MSGATGPSNPTGNAAPSGPSVPAGGPAAPITSTPTAPTGGTTTTASTSTNIKPAITTIVTTLTERMIADPSWPATGNNILDLAQTNWQEWSRRLKLLADRMLVAGYLNGKLACPDPAVDPSAHAIWIGSDGSLRAFILERISPDDYDYASTFDTSHTVFEGLRTRHEKLGLHAQINLLRKAFNIFYEPEGGVPMTTTSKILRDHHDRIRKMGPIDEDKIFLILIINSLGPHHPQLQSLIHGMTDDPNFTGNAALKRVDTEAALVQRRAELGTDSPSVALAASTTNAKSPPVICSNCKKPHHTIDFCIKPGGKMAGRSIDDARAAQRAAAGKAPRSSRPGGQTANVAQAADATATSTTPSANTVQAPSIPMATAQPATTATLPSSVMINGVSYVLTPSPAHAILPSQSANLCDHTGTPLMVDDLLDFRAFLATHDSPKTSLAWEDFSRPVDLADMQARALASTATSSVAAGLADYPFALDTGATCHISPERSDFQTLTPIPPHPIKGLGGKCVYAIGLGTIELSVAPGNHLILQKALFAPASTVRLISVLTLNRDGNCVSHFDSTSCWITNKANGALVAKGVVSPTRNLYTLSTFTPNIVHDPPHPRASNHTSFYAARVPDLETWHRRLGHCNTRAIIDMARNNVAKGMPIDLSAAPPKCDFCILGKQARTPVPKMREGSRATKRLERVFVDLCGPMSVASKTGQLYTMNIIDDYSSYA
jgi:hypothetical protein